MAGILSAFEGGYPANPVISGSSAINEVLTSSSSTAASWQLGLLLQATTGAAGFALQNATPTILTWTAPSDGQLHRVFAVGTELVTVNQIGGGVKLTGTNPDGSGLSYVLNSTGHTTGLYGWGPSAGDEVAFLVQAGATVAVVQTSNQTSGAAVVYGELWGS